MKRRSFSIILALCLLLTMLPQTAWAENETDTASEEATVSESTDATTDTADTTEESSQTSGTCGENLTWTLDSEGTLTISGTGDMTRYGYYNDYVYTPITSPWKNDLSIQNVIIEDGVTSLGDFAFNGCLNLESITIPDSVTFVGWASLRDTAWYDSQPDGVVYVGNVAYDCKGYPKTVVLKEGTVAISKYAFSSSYYLETITIPDGVQRIGDNAFDSCRSLISVVIPDSVTDLGAEVFHSCRNLTEVTIGSGVSFINHISFYNCSSLRAIWVDEDNAAYSSDAYGVLFNKEKTRLQRAPYAISGSYTIPSTVVSMVDYAFDYCTGLTEVIIPDSLQEISWSAFWQCSALTSVTIGTGVTYIDGSAFSYSGLQEITFSGTAPVINESAFTDVTATAYYPANDETWTSDVMQNYGGTITWVAYSNDPEIVESGTCGDNLTWALDSEGTLTISGTGEMWEYDYVAPAWYGDDRIRMLVIEEGVTSITSGTFGSCTNLINIVLPDSLTSIGSSAFTNCSSLTQIKIPAGVTQIGSAPFDGCTQLTCIEVDADNPAYCTDNYSVLFNKAKTQLIQAPGAITGSYQIPDTVVSIGNFAFYGCTGLTDITVPDGVTNIGGYAFALCSGLVSITIPDSVNDIGPVAFGGCTNLVYNSYENGKYLGNESNPYAALMKISSSTAESCEIHWNTKVIAAEICGYNYALTSLVIPDSVTAVSSYAFYDCSNLKEIRFCGNVPYIGSDAFSDITVTAYYPANDETWTSDVMQDYGGSITWVAVSTTAAWLYENGAEKQAYASLADAIADYTGEKQYIKLASDLSVDIALTSDLYIDLNGYDLSGVITLNGYRVYGMDSTTNSYTCDGIGYFNCVDEMGETVVPELHIRSDVTGSIKRYLRIGEDAGYSFHRFYMGITATSIKPATDSVGYKAVFAGDEMVRNYIDTYGYSIRLGTNTPITAEKPGSKMQSGKAVTLRIDGYDAENYGEAKLTARTFITVDGQTIYSASCTSSLRDMIERINEQADSLTASQLAALKEMLERHTVMQSWKVENLL